MGSIGMLVYFFVFFVGAPILVITLVVSNTKRRNQNAAPAPQPVYTQPVQQQTGGNNYRSQQNDVTQEIEKYKDMLDKGLIDEEEFKAKKKQILGI